MDVFDSEDMLVLLPKSQKHQTFLGELLDKYNLKHVKTLGGQILHVRIPLPVRDDGGQGDEATEEDTP